MAKFDFARKIKLPFWVKFLWLRPFVGVHVNGKNGYLDNHSLPNENTILCNISLGNPI